MAMARPVRLAYFFTLSRSTSTSAPVVAPAREAVPRRTSRPKVVMGRLAVPRRLRLCRASRMSPVPLMGRELAGRRKPVTGRPALVVGRMPGWKLLPLLELALGVCSEVPGRGIEATALSSRSTSAMLSSSSSMSSIKFFFSTALHLMNHAAWSPGLRERSSSHSAMHSSRRSRRSLLAANQSGSILNSLRSNCSATNCRG